MIANEASPDANVIWGVAFDPDLDDEMKITIIATGFEKDAEAALQNGAKQENAAAAQPAAEKKAEPAAAAPKAEPAAPAVEPQPVRQQPAAQPVRTAVSYTHLRHIRPRRRRACNKYPGER